MPTLEEIESLAKRRGFFWISSELYGGLSGFYDYGHVGTLMKRKVENLWRSYFLKLNENFFEIDTTNVMHERVFDASGHVEHFVDPIVKCKKCSSPFRADHVIDDLLHEDFEGLTPQEFTDLIKKHKLKCPQCKGELEPAQTFNMMFPLTVGAVGGLRGFLRPETAQGAYTNFLQEFNVARKRFPLGLAIIGRAYRNEISPRQLVNRVREFTQAELQVFFDPDEINKVEKWDEVKDYELVIFPESMRKKKRIIKMKCKDMSENIPRLYVYYMAKMQQFFLDHLKIPKEKFRIKEIVEGKAHYNKFQWDFEVNMESLGGFKEVAGLHYRTDYDLKGHEKNSKQNQTIMANGKKVFPHVIELSFGVDRMVLSLIDVNYESDGKRMWLSLPVKVSPFTLGVFPLVKKDGLDKKAREIYNSLKDWFDCIYDDSGSIGRRYARIDEIGVPFGITVDHKTLEDGTVTIRFRDGTDQERIKIEDIKKDICKLFER